MSVELKPCPFCGATQEDGVVDVVKYGSEYLLFSEEELKFLNFGEDGYTVCCDASTYKGCGASVGWSATEEKAIEKWNSRT